jgi:hypothetical protein
MSIKRRMPRSGITSAIVTPLRGLRSFLLEVRGLHPRLFKLRRSAAVYRTNPPHVDAQKRECTRNVQAICVACFRVR